MTPTYTKPMLRENPNQPAEELNRIDIKNRAPQQPQVDQRVIEQIESLLPRVDAVIIADQVAELNCGVVTDAVREYLAEAAGRFPKCLFFADSRARIGRFRNCHAKPNRLELLAALDHPVRPDDLPASTEKVHRLAEELYGRTGKTVFVTLDRQGILCVDGSGCRAVAAVPVTGPIDVVGAGDATTAGIVTALCGGADPVDAARVGCLVASITIEQLGVTGTATPEQVLARFRQTASAPGGCP